MPFGKYKGQPVTELPHDYLEWLRANVDLFGNLAVEVAVALGEESPVPQSKNDLVDAVKAAALQRLREKDGRILGEMV